MYGYKVRLKGMPETLFACSTTVDNYNWQNNHTENVIEIGVAKSESYLSNIGGESYNLKNSTHLSCIAGKEYRSASCEEGVTIEITCVGVHFENLYLKSCELIEEDAKDNSYFLLPALTNDALLVKEIMPLLNQYINCHTSNLSYDNALCVSIWFKMLSIIDKYTRDFLYKQKKHSDNYYIKKINYIIENKYSEKLSLTEIAKDFGVSMSYLSSTYSSVTKRSFKEALFETRMKKAKELVIAGIHSTSDIAGMVGLCDEVYLRKCFKKFYGVSISEFKKINKGLTLYHDKPVRK